MTGIPLYSPAITPILLGQIVQKMNYKDQTKLWQTSKFAELAVEFFQGKRLKEIEEAKKAEQTLLEQFGLSMAQVSYSFLQRYECSIRVQRDLSRRFNQLVNEKRDEKFDEILNLTGIILKNWDSLHPDKAQPKMLQYDDSIFGY